MAELGRKLLPMEAPRNSRERFAWLVRALRACSADPGMRNTETFAQRLQGGMDARLKPATINKLENGDLDFTLERCIAYEKVLGLADGDLVYPYIWSMRATDLTPKSAWLRVREAGSAEIELLVRLGQDDSLTPMEWLRLSHLYANRKDVFSERLRGYYFHGLIRDFGASYEKDQMLLREAMVNSGSDVIPHILDAVRSEPLNYFNAVEALGYLDQGTTQSALGTLSADLGNPFLTSPILEASLRHANRHHDTKTRSTIVPENIKECIVESLADPSRLFTVRESALCALAALRITGFSLTPTQQKRLSECGEDLRQLSLKPQAMSRPELIGLISGEFEKRLAAGRVTRELSTKIPGLNAVLHEGVFGAERSSRLIVGALLRSWVHSPLVSDALGFAMCEVPDVDFGIQRSLVRLVTKIGNPGIGAHLGRLTATGVRDEGTRLSLAWGIGVSGDPSGDTSLAQLYGATQSQDTKRAVVTAAYRRGFTSLLRDLTEDGDSVVRREAASALSKIGTHQPDEKNGTWQATRFSLTGA